jgi:hypothetical protein
MRFPWIIIASCSLVFFATSWKRSDKSGDLEGIWIGAAFEMDLERYHPWPKVMDFRSDSTLIVRTLGDTTEIVYPWSQGRASLRIDTNLYFKGVTFQVENEQFWVQKPFTRYYHRMRSSQLPENYRELLSDRWWASEEGWHFWDTSGRMECVSRTDTLARQYAWDTDEVNGGVFLLQYGNHLSEKLAYQQFPEQILEINEEEMLVVRWAGSAMKEIRYQRSEPPAYRPADFQLCNPYLYIRNPRHRYYYQGTDLPNGNYGIRKIVDEKYQVPENCTDSGLVRVRFVVNCAGATGQFEVLELNNDYQETQLHPAISEQLLAISRSLTDWIPGRSTSTNEVIDTYYFITYRISHGEVVDIFP